MAEFM